MIFLYYFALSYVAATLLASGVHHGTGLISFTRIVGSHRIIPVNVALPFAIFITCLELAAGGAAVAALFYEEMSVRAPLLFLLCALMGLAFAMYVRQLLRNPKGIASCGCSTFASPLTIASIVPALMLILGSLIGLAAATFGFRSTLTSHLAVVLPLVWGATLALIINLLPASMPQQAA